MSFLRTVVLFLTGAGAAQAGGFDRFQRDETLLLDQAGIVIDVSGTYATAAGEYRSVNGITEHVDIGESSIAGSVRLKISAGNVACLGAITAPFSTDLDFGTAWSQSQLVTAQHLRVVEIGATCSVRLNIQSGAILPIVGLASDQLVFAQDHAGQDGKVENLIRLQDDALSWRIGGAFALTSGITASVIYYSPIHFQADGKLNTPIASGGRTSYVGVTGQAEFPQTVRFDLAIPLSKSWLVSFAGQWADWSALNHVSLLATTATPVSQAGAEFVDLRTFFRDGYTASLSLGHAFATDWAAWGRLSWDRATTTGWTEHSSAFALQFGVRHRLFSSLELSLALTGISVADTDLDRRAAGAPYNAEYDGGILFIPQLSLTSRF